MDVCGLRRCLEALWLQVSGQSAVVTMSTGFQVTQGALIAEGGFSFVFEARAGSSRFAMKKILCQTAEARREARREIEVHNTLAHPSLLRLVDHAIVRGGSGGSQLRSVETVYLLFPLYPGTLRGAIDARLASGLAVDVTEIFRLFRALCEAVAVMHRRQPPWAHRDIKPENVLLSDAGDGSGSGGGGLGAAPVLMDFGSVTAAEVQVRNRRGGPASSERISSEQPKRL